MATTTSRPAIRNPEYTGPNRCLPCTLVNVLVAAVVSVVLGFLLASLTVAVASLGIFLGIIYARGYLVPGTPTLTKEYLPEPVLALFGKDRASAWAERAIGDDGNLDVEAVLIDAGVVTDCPDGEDLCLTSSFRKAWVDRIERTGLERAGANLEAVFDLEIPSVRDGLSVETRAGTFAIEVDGALVGQWESRAAFLADVAAGRELSVRYPEWDTLDTGARNRVLASLRVFLERCPVCDGALEAGTETVSSCCSSYEVFAVTCSGCDARLFEVDVPDLEASPGE